MSEISIADRIRGALVGLIVGDAFGSKFTGLTPQDIIDATGGTGVARFGTKIVNGYERLNTVRNADDVLAATESLLNGSGDQSRNPTDCASPDAVMNAVLIAIPLALCHALAGTTEAERREDLKRLFCLAAPDGQLAYLAAIAIAPALAWPIATGQPIPRRTVGTSDVLNAVDDRLLAAVADHPAIRESYELLYRSFAQAIKGVDSYQKLRQMTGSRLLVQESVPFCLLAAIRNSTDFESALIEAVNAGGDTGRNAAIVGAIVGANVGVNGIPKSWLTAVPEAERAARLAEELSDRARTRLASTAAA